MIKWYRDYPHRTHLRDVLANLFTDEPSIRRILFDAGINTSRIPLSLNGCAIDIWQSVLTETERMDQLDKLLGIVENEFGSVNKVVKELCEDYKQWRTKSYRTYSDKQKLKVQNINRSQVYGKKCTKNQLGVLMGERTISWVELFVAINSILLGVLAIFHCALFIVTVKQFLPKT